MRFGSSGKFKSKCFLEGFLEGTRKGCQQGQRSFLETFLEGIVVIEGAYLVGACFATGDRIFATGSDSAEKLCCDPVAVLAGFQGIQTYVEHGLKGPQKPKTHCDNCSLAILSFTPILTHPTAKGVWQKSDEKSDRNVRKSDQEVTKMEK